MLLQERTRRKSGKVGHIQRACRSGKSQQFTNRVGSKEEKRKLLFFKMADELDDDSLVGSLEVNNVSQAVGDVI